jgi:MFS family permease
MPFLFFWGRAPLLFWTVFSGTLFTLGCTLAPTFEVYYGMKALQGFTLTAGQTCGLAFIQDMFFFHEHARKIGIWTALFLASPYFGPLFANFIIAGTGSWPNVYWLIFGIGCINLLMMFAFLDETWYRRDILPESQPNRGNRLLRIVGLWQFRVHKVYFGGVIRSYRRLVAVFLKPIILPLLIY